MRFVVLKLDIKKSVADWTEQKISRPNYLVYQDACHYNGRTMLCNCKKFALLNML